MPAALEETEITLGIIPLTDCAMIAVAKERGFFAKHGLNVTISKEPSWASLRDRLIIGALDGAHMLAPMAFSATLGLSAAPFPIVTGLSLGLNGNAITISNALHDEIMHADPSQTARPPISPHALRGVISTRKRQGKRPLTFAMVFPFSLHNYLLRYWLATAGIHPDRDLRVIVVPPPQMGGALAAGTIDAFCSGEPWNQAAVHAGYGYVATTGFEIWNNAPEKVFGVSRAWAAQNPNTHLALLRAMIEAAQWLDQRDNLEAAAHILAAPAYIGLDAGIIMSSLVGKYRYHAGEPEVALPDYHVFHRHAANFPWVSHGVWILSQMLRWGQLSGPIDIAALAQEVYRPDLYRVAAKGLETQPPAVDHKPEGHHRGSWTLGAMELGADQFCDRGAFDPARPLDYVEGFQIHNLRSTKTRAIETASSP